MTKGEIGHEELRAGRMKIAGIQLPPLLANAARECRSHVLGAAAFSLGVNLLYGLRGID